MRTETNRSKQLEYLTVYPDGYDPDFIYPLVIMLHGFGSNMNDLSDLARIIDPSGYIYILPNGHMEIPIGPGITGRAWTPLRATRTLDDSLRATNILQGFLGEILSLYKPRPAQSLLLGFSQGGVMAFQCGLVDPAVFGGIAALSSVIPEAELLNGLLPSKRAQPIFISHGIYDKIIPIGMARDTMEYLEGEGYSPDYNEYPIRHEITSDVLDDLVPWVERVIPSARSIRDSQGDP